MQNTSIFLALVAAKPQPSAAACNSPRPIADQGAQTRLTLSLDIRLQGPDRAQIRRGEPNSWALGATALALFIRAKPQARAESDTIWKI
jgi:hypothetical protein